VSALPPRERPGRRRRGPLPAVAALLLAALVFALGVAVGQAVEEGPRPGETQTLVRTLPPADLAPPPETVTVTVSGP
jgi:hypothetical protein